TKVKAQKLKDTRDYSFLLSDDANLPAPSKAPPPRNMPKQNAEGRPTQVPVRSKPSLSNVGKLVHASRDERKLGSAAGHLPHKSGSSYKPSSTSKPSTASADSRKQLGNNSGNGPGRPVGPKGLPPKMSVSTTGNKSSTPGIKNPVNGVQKSVPSKANSSIPKQSMEQRRDIRESNKPKMTPKQPVASSKSQINKPLKQNPMHTSSQDHRPKNKVVRRHPDDVEDEMDISNMIRSMFKYNPKKYVDDDDDDNMEAGFDEIMMEERRSAKIAKKEDDEQLRLIEEEEERERRRRLSKLKKRKLGE
ncbi:Chromatin SPT2, partial [Sesbania bispinosa]